MNYKLVLIILTVALLSALPIPLIKLYNTHDKIGYLLLAVALCIGIALMYVPMLKMADMSFSFSLAKILSVIAVVVIGVVLFKEKMTLLSGIGVALGLISVVLMVYGVEKM